MSNFGKSGVDDVNSSAREIDLGCGFGFGSGFVRCHV